MSFFWQEISIAAFLRLMATWDVMASYGIGLIIRVPLTLIQVIFWPL